MPTPRKYFKISDGYYFENLDANLGIYVQLEVN